VRAWWKLCEDERKAEVDLGYLLNQIDTPEG
jgi:hypothetical protein